MKKDNNIKPGRIPDLQLTNYVKVGDRIILREALSDNHPESWPYKYQEKYGATIYQHYGSNWRDYLSDADEVDVEEPEMSIASMEFVFQEFYHLVWEDRDLSLPPYSGRDSLEAARDRFEFYRKTYEDRKVRMILRVDIELERSDGNFED